MPAVPQSGRRPKLMMFKYATTCAWLLTYFCSSALHDQSIYHGEARNNNSAHTHEVVKVDIFASCIHAASRLDSPVAFVARSRERKREPRKRIHSFTVHRFQITTVSRCPLGLPQKPPTKGNTSRILDFSFTDNSVRSKQN